MEEVKHRIGDIQIDRVLDAGYVEQFIEDNPRSPFPQVQSTERPDKAVGNILEGRVAILVEGSPYALIVPSVFNQFYHTSEDYNERFMITSIIRMIRFLSLIFSLTFSSFYITVLSYHPEMIPAKFVVAASSGRAGVPFPVVVEVFLMEVAMEILREATVRMPQQVGGALSIVGVLVIGQAAVMAGFVSPITVVIIAMSTIGSFEEVSINDLGAKKLEQIEKAANQKREELSRRLIKKFQKEGSDVLGLGARIRAKYGTYWDEKVKTEEQWSEIYKRMDIHVKVQHKIKRSGMEWN